MYETKKGRGPFAGIAIGKSGYSYEFYYPYTSGGPYNRHQSSMMADLWRFELGYFWNSKPIYFKKIWDNGLSNAEVSALKKKGWSVRLQPLIGLAYQRLMSGWDGTLNYVGITEKAVPGELQNNFAIITGLNFEFGKNDKRKFALSLTCVKGIGRSLNRAEITVNTPLDNYKGLFGSNGTSLNITLALPFKLWSKE